MKQTVFLLTMLLSFLSSTSQNKENLEKYNLIGKIKTIETSPKNASTGQLYTWRKQYFNEKGFLTKEESKYGSEGRIKKRQIFYNTKGNEILDTKKKSYGRTEYVYDDKQNLVEIIYQDSRTIFTYRNDGNIDKKLNRNLDDNRLKSALQYRFKSDGSYQISSKYYLEDGRISLESRSSFNRDRLVTSELTKDYKKLYFYDGKNMIKEEGYRKGELRETKFYKYQKDGLLIEEKQIADGRTAVYSLEYDDFGNVTKEIEPRGDIDSYIYEYDAKNNWIKKSKYNDGIISTITTRTIQYYGDNLVDGPKPIPFALADVKPKIGNCKEDNCFGVELTNLLKKSIPKNRYIEFGITKSKRFNISFVIEKDGSVTNIIVHRAFKDFKEHLIKQLQSINNIVPGQKNNESIRTQFSIPLIFK